MFDQGDFEAFEAWFVLGFGSGDEDGLGVGGSEEPPAIVGEDSDAVDFVDVGAGGFEAGGDFDDDFEFAGIVAVEAEFGGVDDFGKGFADGGKFAVHAGDDAHEADGDVEGVVEAVPAVGVEDVAAHFPGEGGGDFGHLGLDEAVAGFEHHGDAAGAGDLVVEDLAGLDVGDDGGAGVGAQDVAGEDDHELVAEEHAAAVVDGADAVGVAVEADAEVGLGFQHGVDELFLVLGDGGVGVMGGEGSVDGAVEDGVVAGEFLEEFFEDFAGGAVGVVPDDAELAVAAVPVLDEAVDVGFGDVDGFVGSRPSGRTSPVAAMRPRVWMSAPKKALRPSIILNPL